MSIQVLLQNLQGSTGNTDDGQSGGGAEKVEDYIIITENSIYLANADIDTKRIS